MTIRECVESALDEVGTKTSLALLRAAASDWNFGKIQSSDVYLVKIRSDYRKRKGIVEDARTHKDVPDRNMIMGETNVELKVLLAATTMALAKVQKFLAKKIG